MSRHRIAAILAAATLAGALGLGIARNSRAAPDAAGPQDAVYGMLESARQGDVARYLRHFDGEALAAIRQGLREAGEASFASYLRDTTSRIEGVAVSDPDATGDSVRIRVDYVYRDRTAVQQAILAKQGARWLIVRLEGEVPGQMPVPFGTAMR